MIAQLLNDRRCAVRDRDLCDCEVIHEEAVAEVREKLEAPKVYDDLAALLRLFGDGTRAKLLHALEQRELCVCDLAALLGVTKSAVSHQLKALKMADLVKNRREGQVVYYSLADDHVKAILDMGFEHLKE
ncbi:MAG: helix-turn-helix transcriptional regulator [Oscillospiraceae bacterium]|nr:helix-turn-helix transcriptional regulator [Oscillospiraceae bacterium]